METTALFLTRSELDAWISSVRHLLHIPEIQTTYKKATMVRKRLFASQYTPEDLIDKICEVQGFTPEQLKGKRGKQGLSDTRACVSFILHEVFPNLYLSQIGEYIGRDHATVVYHLRIVPDTDGIRELYEEIRRKIKL